MRRKELMFYPVVLPAIFWVLGGLWGAPSVQAESLAHLAEPRGSVVVTQLSGVVLRPAPQSSTGLSGGDRVDVGPRSSAHVLYRPDTVIELGEGASMKVHEMPTGRRISAYAGRLLTTVTPGSAASPRLEIGTPSGVVVIEGTIVETLIEGERTRVSVPRGEVVFVNSYYDLQVRLGEEDSASFEIQEDRSLRIQTYGKDLILEVGEEELVVYSEQALTLEPAKAARNPWELDVSREADSDGFGGLPPFGMSCVVDPRMGVLPGPCTFGVNCCNGLCCGPVMFPSFPIGDFRNHDMVCCQSEPGMPARQACCSPEDCASGGCDPVPSPSTP